MKGHLQTLTVLIENVKHAVQGRSLNFLLFLIKRTLCDGTDGNKIQVTVDDTTSKRVTSCVPKETSVGSFLEELEKDLQKYPGHIFRAKWQHSQVQTCIENLNDNTVIMLMDFSENYRCCVKYACFLCVIKQESSF